MEIKIMNCAKNLGHEGFASASMLLASLAFMIPVFYLASSILSASASSSTDLISLSAVNNYKLSTEILVTNLENELRIPGALDKIITKNWENDPSSPLQCLKTAGACSSLQGQKHLISYVHKANGELLIDLSNPHSGIDNFGHKCEGFNSSTSTNSQICGMRLELYWEPICEDSSCTNVTHHFTTEMKRSSSSPLSLVPMNLSLSKYNLSLNL